jgi:O-antigen/teichoic acid export membrane protein
VKAARVPGTSGGKAIFRNTFVLGLARVIDRVGGAAVTLLIARELGASSLGVYAAAMGIYGLMAIAGEAGTTNYLVREIARHPDETGRYVVHLSVIATCAATALALLGLAIVPVVGWSGALATAISIVVLALPATTLNSVQEAAFVAHGRVELETLTTFAGSCLNIVVAVVLVLTDQPVTYFVAAYVVIEYLVTATYYVLINRYVARLPLRFQPRLAWRLVLEIKAFTASSLLAALFSRPEIVMLSVLASTQQVGYYGAAIKVAELGTFVPQVFMANVFPVMSRSYHVRDGRFNEVQERATRYMIGYSLPIAVGLLVLADPIVDLLFGRAFAPTAELIQVLAANVVLTAISAVLWRVLTATGRQGRLLQVQSITIVFRLGVGYALIATYAALGASITTAASALLTVVLLAIVVKRSGGVLGMVRGGVGFGAAALVAGVSAWLLEQRGEPWLAAVAIAVGYAVGAFVFGAFTRDERDYLRGLRPWRRGLQRLAEETSAEASREPNVTS